MRFIFGRFSFICFHQFSFHIYLYFIFTLVVQSPFPLFFVFISLLGTDLYITDFMEYSMKLIVNNNKKKFLEFHKSYDLMPWLVQNRLQIEQLRWINVKHNKKKCTTNAENNSNFNKNVDNRKRDWKTGLKDYFLSRRVSGWKFSFHDKDSGGHP